MQTVTQTTPAISAPVQPGKRLATIEQAALLYPFTAAALRDLKFRAHDRHNSRGEVIRGNGTGAHGVWLQIGRKVLIDLEALDRWIESHKLAA